MKRRQFIRTICAAGPLPAFGADAKKRPNVILVMTDFHVSPCCTPTCASLMTGKTRPQTWLMDKNDKPLCGAYYVTVKREG